MSFKSRKVTTAEEGKLRVVGDLTIKGNTRGVILNVDGLTVAIKDPKGNLRRGASATTRVNRKDFGLMWNVLLDTGGAVVGYEVTLPIDAEFTRKGNQ